MICVRDNDARETLCKTGISVNGAHITLHLNNPRTVHRVGGGGGWNEWLLRTYRSGKVTLFL